MKNLPSIINAFIVATSIAGLASCDIIKNKEVYEQVGTNPIVVDSTKPARKIFLEIFTGFKCPNCPEQTLNGLASIASAKLEDKTIIMKIHQGFFAFPSGKFKMNFQTTAGNDLGKNFAILGYPTGVVNRKKFNSSYSVSPGDWSSKVSKESLTANVDIKMTKNYDVANRSLKVSISSLLYENAVNKLYTYAYIVEDSISYWQIDGSDEVENFVHREMLRDAIPSATGSDLFSPNSLKGAKANKEFTNYALKPEWNAKHCEVIVIITDAVTGEVLQAEKKKVIE